MKALKITDAIQQSEKRLIIYKAVCDKFPDTTIKYYGFASKQVNRLYTDLSFERHYSGLYVCPVYKMIVPINDNEEEIIDIHTSPKTSRLIHIAWNREQKSRVIKFSRLAINLKNHNFKDDMLRACRTKIMEFIKDNPKYSLDTKHLEPRLKKLLIFT